MKRRDGEEGGAAEEGAKDSERSTLEHMGDGSSGEEWKKQSPRVSELTTRSLCMHVTISLRTTIMLRNSDAAPQGHACLVASIGSTFLDPQLVKAY